MLFNKILWRTGAITFIRRLTLSFAIIAEIFGEPFPRKRRLPNKSLIYKIAQPCNTSLLKHLQRLQKENPVRFELMVGDNLDATIELEIIDLPPVADCVIQSTLRAKRLNDMKQLQIKDRKQLRNKKRKDLRITEKQQLRKKSQIKAKKIARFN
jgi:hypothetical protein